MPGSDISKSILGFVLPAVNGTVCKPCDTRELIREPQFYRQSLTSFQQTTSLSNNLHYQNKLNNTKQSQPANGTIEYFILNYTTIYEIEYELFLRL